MARDPNPSPAPNSGVGLWGWNGTDWEVLLVDESGRVQVTEVKPSTSAVTQVVSSTTTVLLKAANTDRKGLFVSNDSTQVLYVKYGTTASATDYSVKIASQGYYEIPFPVYTGRLDGIWASANGYAYVTELT